MKKLDPKTDGSSLDILGRNIDQMREMFPEVFTEGSDEDGPRWKVDMEALGELLGEYVEHKQERYSFNWHGKARAKRIAQTPSTGTLRPCPEESVNWDTTKNIFIEGDNLEVLKLLQKSYHKKVKMIYIDPPYNTGKEFIYPDKFQDNLDTYLKYTGQAGDDGLKISANSETGGRYHTNWLNMMYPRLKLARNLLRDDGVIFISIDDNEVNSLRAICDEIFGEENFVDPIVWKKRYGGGAKEKHLVALHEYVLVYAKSKDTLPNMFVPLQEESIQRYYKSKDEHFATKGPYRTHPLEAMKSFGARDNLRFPIPTPDGGEVMPKRQWRWGRERVETALHDGEIEFIKKQDGSWVLSSKQYLKDENGDIRKTKPFSLIDDVYTQHGTNEMDSIFGNARVFSFPKPSAMVSQLVTIGLNFSKDDIVLDFFAGAATTAHSVMELNNQDEGDRRFILVQLPEQCPDDSDAQKGGFDTIADIGKERIRRVGQQFVAGSDESSLDVGFRVFKPTSSNIVAWNGGAVNDLLTATDSLLPNRRPADLATEILLKFGLDLGSKVESRTVGKNTLLSVSYGALVMCLDDDISQTTAELIADLVDEMEPEASRVVLKDSGFKDDVAKTNAIQILRQRGIEDVKTI